MSEWGERDWEGEKGGKSRTSLRGRLRGSSTRLEHSGQWNGQRVPRHTVKMRGTNCTTRVYIMRRVRVHGHLRPMLHRATLHSIGAYRGRVDVCARNISAGIYHSAGNSVECILRIAPTHGCCVLPRTALRQLWSRALPASVLHSGKTPPE